MKPLSAQGTRNTDCEFFQNTILKVLDQRYMWIVFGDVFGDAAIVKASITFKETGDWGTHLIIPVTKKMACCPKT
jgi:hypothetical protein